MTAGIRHDEMRKRNRAMVITAVRRAGRVSRTHIARVTGLSHSTISAITADLIAEGIVREVPSDLSETPRRGRPQVTITPNAEAARIVCLNLSFNSLSAILFDYCGEAIDRRSYHLSTLEMSREALLDAVIEAVNDVTAGHGPVMCIGFAVQGITDAAGREMLWSPITRHANIAFAPALEEAFAVPVTVHNDCNLIAAALHGEKPKRYGNNFVAILLSYGIGMGLMLNGKTFTGKRSSAGEFGHMNHRPDGPLCRCGRRGCIEAYAGDYGLWRSAHGTETPDKPIADIGAAQIEALAGAARAGDASAREAFRCAGEALGYGLGNLFALIDPVPIAMVGYGTTAFDLLEPAIRQSLAQTAGGQHADALNFETVRDEAPLIERGCATTVLDDLDQELFAAGLHMVQPARAPRANTVG